MEAEGKLVDQVLEKHPQFEEQISTMHQTSSLMKMPRTTRACLKSLELSEARLGQTEEGMADITDSDGINGAGQDHQDEQATEQRDGTFGVDTTPGLLG